MQNNKKFDQLMSIQRPCLNLHSSVNFVSVFYFWGKLSSRILSCKLFLRSFTAH